VTERRNFKVAGEVDHIKSKPTDKKLSLKAKWSRHVTNFKFWGPQTYPETSGRGLGGACPSQKIKLRYIN